MSVGLLVAVASPQCCPHAARRHMTHPAAATSTHAPPHARITESSHRRIFDRVVISPPPPLAKVRCARRSYRHAPVSSSLSTHTTAAPRMHLPCMH